MGGGEMRLSFFYLEYDGVGTAGAQYVEEKGRGHCGVDGVTAIEEPDPLGVRVVEPEVEGCGDSRGLLKDIGDMLFPVYGILNLMAGLAVAAVNDDLSCSALFPQGLGAFDSQENPLEVVLGYGDNVKEHEYIMFLSAVYRSLRLVWCFISDQFSDLYRESG